MSPQPDLCPEDELDALLQALSGTQGPEILPPLLERYPDDPRLRFLLGSLQAAARDYAAAKTSFAAALDLAPDYAIARFQLGLLHYTSGETDQAEALWGPLADLAQDDPLRLFAQGLVLVQHGEMADGVACLETGLALNGGNPPLNANIALILAEIANPGTDDPAVAEDTETRAASEANSETAMLLHQFSRSTRH